MDTTVKTPDLLVRALKYVPAEPTERQFQTLKSSKTVFFENASCENPPFLCYNKIKCPYPDWRRTNEPCIFHIFKMPPCMAAGFFPFAAVRFLTCRRTK